MKAYLAEFIGTFALVFFGTGAVIVDQHTNGSLGLGGISAAFGLIIMAMIYVFANVSGTHINPAVTIALAMIKKIALKEASIYIIVQVLGAIAASFLLKFLFPKSLTLGMTLPSGEILQSLIIEIIATFFLMLTILGITSQKEKTTTALAGIVIGLTVSGLIFVAGPISGGSFNPARSIGPALAVGNFSSLWIYLIAPTGGAIFATLLWLYFNNQD